MREDDLLTGCLPSQMFDHRPESGVQRLIGSFHDLPWKRLFKDQKIRIDFHLPMGRNFAENTDRSSSLELPSCLQREQLIFFGLTTTMKRFVGELSLTISIKDSIQKLSSESKKACVDSASFAADALGERAINDEVYWLRELARLRVTTSLDNTAIMTSYLSCRRQKKTVRLASGPKPGTTLRFTSQEE